MKLVGLAVAGLVLGAAPAFAQYGPPRPPMPVGASSSAQDAAEIVEAMGLEPVGMPARSGPFYVVSARDDYGRLLQVTVDARRSQVMAVEGNSVRGVYGPHPAYGPPRGYGRPGPYALDDDFDGPPPRSIAGPGSIMSSRTPPNTAARTVHTPPAAHAPATPQAAAPKAAKSASAAPVPRKRPAAAPQETAGSVEPLPAKAAPAPAETAPPKPAPSQMAPVAPLE